MYFVFPGVAACMVRTWKSGAFFPLWHCIWQSLFVRLGVACGVQHGSVGKGVLVCYSCALLGSTVDTCSATVLGAFWTNCTQFLRRRGLGSWSVFSPFSCRMEKVLLRTARTWNRDSGSSKTVLLGSRVMIDGIFCFFLEVFFTVRSWVPGGCASSSQRFVDIHLSFLLSLRRKQQQQQALPFTSVAFLVAFSVTPVVDMDVDRDAGGGTGSARRRRERRLPCSPQVRTDERLEGLAESQHQSAQRQKTARAGGRGSRRSTRRSSGGTHPSQEPGTQYFFSSTTTACRSSGARGLTRLAGVRPQERVPRHIVEQIVDSAPILPLLQPLVPQTVDSVGEVLKILDKVVPDVEQVVDVPMIFPEDFRVRTFRSSLLEPQTAEQLVEVLGFDFVFVRPIEGASSIAVCRAAGHTWAMTVHDTGWSDTAGPGR